MKIAFVGALAAALVAGCATQSTLPAPPASASAGSAAQGAEPNVGQPGSPAPRWTLVGNTIFRPGEPVLGADNDIWFRGEDISRHQVIARVTPLGDERQFEVSPRGAGITALTNGPDGNIWFTLIKFQPAYFAVGFITSVGSITEFPMPTKPINSLNGIATGSDGNLWVTRESLNGQDDEIDKVTTTGVETRYPIGTSKVPGDIILGPDGAMWFAELSANAIGRITTTGHISEFKLPAGLFGPIFLVRAGDGDVWFNYFDQATSVASIGKITPSGTMTMYSNPQPENTIDGLVVGPDGDLWFPESTGDRFHDTWQLRRITLSGEYDNVKRPIPLTAPYTGGEGIATGADGNLWVSESNEGRFAVWAWRRMTVAPASVTVSVGQSESIATSETNYSGGWTAKSSNVMLATVTSGQQHGAFVVHGHASGTCTVKISDTFGNFYSEPVTVR